MADQDKRVTGRVEEMTGFFNIGSKNREVLKATGI